MNTGDLQLNIHTYIHVELGPVCFKFKGVRQSYERGITDLGLWICRWMRIDRVLSAGDRELRGVKKAVCERTYEIAIWSIGDMEKGKPIELINGYTSFNV